ncbi:uncharacterized protein ARMOST_08506 [Armillaria ostoyae]|uniref:Uncharacterized protein n=1 Tax=Armillaria ostoyae TaxID=47428 RepID=A0A284R8W2_ARMOS|nr:uncharacterized protein ARMOST_08506 [Armillaria ostoyae]
MKGCAGKHCRTTRNAPRQHANFFSMTQLRHHLRLVFHLIVVVSGTCFDSISTKEVQSQEMIPVDRAIATTTGDSLFNSHPPKRKTLQDTEVSTPESTSCKEIMRRLLSTTKL